MIYKLMRKLTKPFEDATIDVATDLSTKTARRTAEKSAEAGVDTFFNSVDYAAKRTREKAEEAGAFALYCMKGGIVTEFRLAARRLNDKSEDIRKQREKKLKSGSPKRGR